MERRISIFIGNVDVPSWSSVPLLSEMQRGKPDEQEARVTLGHQILENFNVTIGSGGMPGSVISVRVNQRCHNQPKPALTSACMCMGLGCLVIRLDQKIRAAHTRNPRKSRDLAVRSVPSEKSNVRLIAQLEKKIGHETNPDSVQIAVACSDPDVFLLADHCGWRVGALIGEMMGDMIEGEDLVSVHTWVDYWRKGRDRPDG